MSSAPDPRIAKFRSQLAVVDVLRAQQQWSAALDGYLDAITHAPQMPSLHHNASLCLFALARYDEALPYATQALRLDPQLWQARLICVKVLRKLKRLDEAMAALASEPRQDIPSLQTERASFALHELGDAARAGELVPSGSDSNTQPEARLLACLAALYDPGSISPEQIAARLQSYSDDHLGALSNPKPVKKLVPSATRPRVGVISPQLRATPVYFLGIGALRLLAAHIDLVFFHRNTKEDWATDQFRSIAHEWIDVAALEPTALEQEIRRHQLDTLIDMGGWMDTQALKALATKPAKRMYKWVGGQAASTGLAAFDRFLSDIEQTPLELQPLYAEPLHLLASGYVTYTPPPYFPCAKAADPGVALGVIANPAKISRAFLHYLAKQCIAWRDEGIDFKLRFIEHRFRHVELQKRIQTALGHLAPLEFIVPEGHVAYLNEVARLHTVIDTFPYTGGLTTIEALMLGVPCRTRAGTLFCERHTLAHCRYAGMAPQHYLLDGWRPTKAQSLVRTPLLAADSPRLRHDRLADELLRIIATH